MLKSREAARMIGISPRTLAKWRQRGVGPQCVRLGYNLVVYRLSDIDTWTRTRARHMPKATADDPEGTIGLTVPAGPIRSITSHGSGATGRSRRAGRKARETE